MGSGKKKVQTPLLYSCAFCGAEGLRKGAYSEISGEHILKKSILLSLGLQDAPVKRIIHRAKDDTSSYEVHERKAGGLKEPNICKKCNNEVFNKIDEPVEPLVKALVNHELGFADLKGKSAESLAWWILKVAVITGISNESKVMPPWISKLLLAKFRDGEEAAWPAGAVAFSSRLLDEEYAVPLLNGSPIGYGEGAWMGASFVSAIRYRDILLGVAWRGMQMSDPVFVRGIHAPFFPDPAFFRWTETPYFPERYRTYRPNCTDAALGSVGFRLLPEITLDYVIVGNELKPPPSQAGVSLTGNWLEAIVSLRYVGAKDEHELIGRSFHAVGAEVRPHERDLYQAGINHARLVFSRNIFAEV